MSAREVPFSLTCSHSETITPEALDALHGFGDYYTHYGKSYYGDNRWADCIEWWCGAGHPRTVDAITPDALPFGPWGVDVRRRAEAATS